MGLLDKLIQEANEAIQSVKELAETEVLAETYVLDYDLRELEKQLSIIYSYTDNKKHKEQITKTMKNIDQSRVKLKRIFSISKDAIIELLDNADKNFKENEQEAWQYIIQANYKIDIEMFNRMGLDIIKSERVLSNREINTFRNCIRQLETENLADAIHSLFEFVDNYQKDKQFSLLELVIIKELITAIVKKGGGVSCG